MANLNKTIQDRIKAGLCVGCGQPLSQHELKNLERTTCQSCQDRFEQEAHDYWRKFYEGFGS